MEAIHVTENLVGNRANLHHQPRHPADILASWADIGRTKLLLEWRPWVPFEDGIRRLVEWYSRNQPWAKDISTS